MQAEQLAQFEQWYNRYSDSFFTGEDAFVESNVRLKIAHTHRVRAETRSLAWELGLDQSKELLAEAIALFHDVGRFEQFKKYRTYKDTISENHCLLGLKILREHGVLEEMDKREREVLETAIEFHGAKQAPTGLDEDSNLFTQIIRDADKLDIYQLLIINYRRYHADPENFEYEVEFPNEPRCSERIVEAILNNQLIEYEWLDTIHDAKLLQLGWVFDINFDHSLRQIKERKFLEDLIDLLPDVPEAHRAANHVLGYLDVKLKSA